MTFTTYSEYVWLDVGGMQIPTGAHTDREWLYYPEFNHWTNLGAPMAPYFGFEEGAVAIIDDYGLADSPTLEPPLTRHPEHVWLVDSSGMDREWLYHPESNRWTNLESGLGQYYGFEEGAAKIIGYFGLADPGSGLTTYPEYVWLLDDTAPDGAPEWIYIPAMNWWQCFAKDPTGLLDGQGGSSFHGFEEGAAAIIDRFGLAPLDAPPDPAWLTLRVSTLEAERDHLQGLLDDAAAALQEAREQIETMQARADEFAAQAAERLATTTTTRDAWYATTQHVIASFVQLDGQNNALIRASEYAAGYIEARS